MSEPVCCRLCAGARGIRTPGPSREGVALSREGKGAEVDRGGLERRSPFSRRTSGSNPCRSAEFAAAPAELRATTPSSKPVWVITWGVVLVRRTFLSGWSGPGLAGWSWQGYFARLRPEARTLSRPATSRPQQVDGVLTLDPYARPGTYSAIDS